MSLSNTRKKKSIQLVAESILHLSVIPLSLAVFFQGMTLSTQELQLALNDETIATLESLGNPSEGVALSAALFLVLAAIRVLQAFRNREKGKSFFAVSLIQAGFFLVCAALPLICGFTLNTLSFVSGLYAGAMILSRVFSMVRDHRLGNVLLNILGILAFLISTVAFILTDMMICFLAVLSLMKIIFGRISMTTLRKIIRKTYAAEIVFGLLLLIITFSFLLYFFEPGMNSLKDALWYCFAIVTTIGFGDFTAQTDLGRILSVILGIYGIIVVALITSIIVNFYGEMKKDENDSGEGESFGE